MSKNIHEPIEYTDQKVQEMYQKLRNMYKKAIIYSVLIVVASIAWTIWQPTSWMIWILSIPLLIIVMFAAYSARPDKSLEAFPKTQFTLNENGIHEVYLAPKTDEIKGEHSIPFSSINQVLIGNYLFDEHNTHSKKKNKDKRYYPDAVMIIEYEDGRYKHRFDSVEELKDWLPRFLDKGCPVFRTDYNLAPALLEGGIDSLELSGINKEPWNETTTYPPIGKPYSYNPFVAWENTYSNQS